MQACQVPHAKGMCPDHDGHSSLDTIKMPLVQVSATPEGWQPASAETMKTLMKRQAVTYSLNIASVMLRTPSESYAAACYRCVLARLVHRKALAQTGV